jgi:hypothetical protein
MAEVIFRPVRDPEKQAFFERVCEIKNEDHPHLKFLKQKIDKLMKQELELLDFKD